MMAKVTEKMLFDVYLDLWYSNKYNEEYIREIKSMLSDAQKSRRKIAKLLKNVEESFIKLAGHPPINPDNKKGK